MNQFEISEKYFLLCDEKGTPNLNCRVYQNVYLATFDLALSCLQFMSHKNKVAMMPVGASVSEVVSSVCMKHLVSVTNKKENEHYGAFLEALDSSTNFVFWTAENEITGEIYYTQQQCDEIHQILNRKRIFSIQYVMSSRETNIDSQLNYSFYIKHAGLFHNGSEATNVFFSNQQKMNFVVAPYQNVDRKANSSNISKNFPELPKNISHNYFEKYATAKQVKDRFVFLFPNATALSVKQYLGLNDAQAFTPAGLPSWVVAKWETWWPESRDLNLNKLLVISSEVIINDIQFFDKVNKALHEIKSESDWIIS